ncbi:hypothetical protein M8C21_018777 [Ambrosia artemisiifolia]|uniref:Uncharacterized protein n=1 Tax=Ambrosia artemisiifolia TaxID=4212 RepID=A0AAD5CXV3_AMBAR|nr:hypothetical protein M8C21_018777 [Ambrosia artemisiifolia]
MHIPLQSQVTTHSTLEISVFSINGFEEASGTNLQKILDVIQQDVVGVKVVVEVTGEVTATVIHKMVVDQLRMHISYTMSLMMVMMMAALLTRVTCCQVQQLKEKIAESEQDKIEKHAMMEKIEENSRIYAEMNERIQLSQNAPQTHY